ncbi:hypothetical protein LJC33_05350 [Eubacteriales bacterium OttesenSCG-928-N13]|nr:hypothetical protein [Eubacteriales bacterium OttesenSCG-928-N13]
MAELIIIFIVFFAFRTLFGKNAENRKKQAKRGPSDAQDRATTSTDFDTPEWVQHTAFSRNAPKLKQKMAEPVPSQDHMGSLGHHSSTEGHSTEGHEFDGHAHTSAYVPLASRLNNPVKAQEMKVDKQSAIDQSDLKRAIVMSEILAKPVSIRRR